MEKGKIIVLNGVSSSGKSTLSKELVRRQPNYFHFSGDEYDYIIEKMEDRDQGRLIPIPTEDFIHRTIAMFSDKGVNLIVDQILHNELTINDFYTVLKDYPVFLVGVHCSPDELEKREINREDRRIGMAKEQLKFVHQQNEKYDIEVDTSIHSIEECANQIINRLYEYAQ